MTELDYSAAPLAFSHGSAASSVCSSASSDDGDGGPQRTVRNRELAKTARLNKKSNVDTLIVRLEQLQGEARNLNEQILQKSATNHPLPGGFLEVPVIDGLDTITLDDLMSSDLVDKMKEAVHVEAEQSLQVPFPSRSDAYRRSRSEEEVAQNKQIRKARNRVHARLSRDRSRLFSNKVEQAIRALERQNQILYNRLKSVSNLKYLIEPENTKTVATASLPGAWVESNGMLECI